MRTWPTQIRLQILLCFLVLVFLTGIKMILFGWVEEESGRTWGNGKNTIKIYKTLNI